MRNPTRYTLQELIGWEEFERLCCSFLFAKGHKDIQSAGKVKDGGRDAVVLQGKNERIIFQISKEKDPLLDNRDTRKKPSKFWREYTKWQGHKKTKKFVFVSSESLGSQKIDLMKDLSNPDVVIFDVDDLENFLDFDPTGIEIKRQYAIFSKDLQEIFGASDRDAKLNEVATVINDDSNYNITTVLSGDSRINGAVFSTTQGNVSHHFVPKSIEHYKNAVPTVKMTLAVPNTDDGKSRLQSYTDAIKYGGQVSIPADDIRDLEFKLGKKLLFDGEQKPVMVSIGPSLDQEPRNFILRSPRNPGISIRTQLKIISQNKDSVVMNNHALKSPIDIEMAFSKDLSVKVNYTFHLDRCFDALEAYKYARYFNELQQTTTEIVHDDKGIERKLSEIPARGKDTLSEKYMNALYNMTRIQDFFKVRLPNPFGDRELTKDDFWSISTLIDLIDNNKADIKMSKASFVLASDKAEEMIEKQRTPQNDAVAMAFGGTPVGIISILGVSEFPNIEIIFPEVFVKSTKIDDENTRFDIEIVNEKAYLRLTDYKNLEISTPSDSEA